ncbi:MAG: COG3014 family protein [Gallionellaceae bacterium]|jgi:hypothetical protein
MHKKKYHVQAALIKFGLVVTVCVLQGCATYSANFAKVEDAAAKRDLGTAVKALDELKLTGNDEALFFLNKATLLRLQGRYAESNKYFEQAKQLMESLNAISVTEQAASVTVNDSLKAYEGLPNEQLMVYSFEALNYLQMGNIDDAAVEARQFNVKQHLIAEKYPKAKYLSGAFVRYLNGMIYEAAGERDDARIEMRKAVDGYKAENCGFPIPQALSADLERLRKESSSSSKISSTGEVTLILHNGLGPTLDEHNLRVVNPAPGHNGPLMFSLAIPKYVRRLPPVARIVLSANSNTATSEIVDDENALGAKSFNDRLPLIIARGVARMVIKNAAAQETKKKVDNPLFSLVADIGTNLSERADTRTWSLIPANILMTRLPLPATGKPVDVTATYYGANGNILGTREFKGLDIQAGKKIFVSDYYMNPPAPPKAGN